LIKVRFKKYGSLFSVFEYGAPPLIPATDCPLEPFVCAGFNKFHGQK